MSNKFFTLKRQDLLYLKKSEPLHNETICGDSERHLIEKWIASGLPAIIRRPGITSDGKGIHCGIPMPPDEGKRRISFAAALDSIKSISPLPPALELSDIAEAHGRNDLRFFTEQCRKSNFAPRCFGSLAWEKITGKRYFRKTSDIDIQIEVKNNAELYRLQKMLDSMPEAASLYDIEITLWNGDSFSWREFINSSEDLMIKNIRNVFLVNKGVLRKSPDDVQVIAEKISYEAAAALQEELETFPKPGLVSYFDSGSHNDMDAGLFTKSIKTLRPYFGEIALAGMKGAEMSELRKLGLNAEKMMFEATGGINTHRGAVFTMGLLAAAAGYKLKNKRKETLGETVKTLWSGGIMDPSCEDRQSHGYKVKQLYGLSGAAEEAATGFPAVYGAALPVLKNSLNKYCRNTARLCSFFALLEKTNDSTLLYRGGTEGLEFAKRTAVNLNKNFIPDTDEWNNELLRTHQSFIEKKLSPGGAADLLSAAIFIQRIDEICQG